MPIIKSAIKRARQTLKRRDRNVGIKRDIKGATKALAAKPTSENLSKAQSEIDKAVKKGLIKKNTAARRKSALAKAAKAAGVKLTPAKPARQARQAGKATSTAKAAPKATAKPAPVKATVAKQPAAKAAAKKPAAKKPAAKKTTK